MANKGGQSGQRHQEPRHRVNKGRPSQPAFHGASTFVGGKGNVAVVQPPEPKTVKGQKHVPPVGRHSAQTHRLAAERAATQGHSGEREQHDFDRSVVQADLNKLAMQRLKNQENKQK